MLPNPLQISAKFGFSQSREGRKKRKEGKRRAGIM